MAVFSNQFSNYLIPFSCSKDEFTFRWKDKNSEHLYSGFASLNNRNTSYYSEKGYESYFLLNLVEKNPEQEKLPCLERIKEIGEYINQHQLLDNRKVQMEIFPESVAKANKNGNKITPGKILRIIPIEKFALYLIELENNALILMRNQEFMKLKRFKLEEKVVNPRSPDLMAEEKQGGEQTSSVEEGEQKMEQKSNYNSPLGGRKRRRDDEGENSDAKRLKAERREAKAAGMEPKFPLVGGGFAYGPISTTSSDTEGSSDIDASDTLPKP